ncbi:TIGR02452 family protein [Promicromonospora sp. MEB111]|uniref:TIGR02452 family protein n=1 Tax=Promicromonospora sp. MEB111 TaxID=3040301 RepID=UPI00254C7A3B|nr:TIGR02452 family protein [Promicromonospora sp. MEB111]
MTSSNRSRDRFRALAAETMDAVRAGSYSAGERRVDIADQVAAAAAGTRLILPGTPLSEGAAWSGPTTVEVRDESSLAAARRLGPGTACLVFASARNPGGGFLNGAQAQEEAIARSSALYATQTSAPEFYEHHRRETSLLYSDRVILSPDVPVIRDDDGVLLAEPYPVTFLTAAAPNLSAIERNQPPAVGEVRATLARRAARVLDVAAAHGSRRIVLGAWGCGVFGNDPADVASAFAEALAERPRFEHVTFAILDARPGQPVLGAFEKRLRTAYEGA